jgi:heme/copper-type cytochrome/quinol oxidase subunit 2
MCLVDVASACPTCKDAMAGDPANSNMVQGYFWSIIFMMSMPFLVFSTVAAYFYYEVCRARKQQAAATVTPTNASPNTSASPEIALLS